jgi:hypothetical protein
MHIFANCSIYLLSTTRYIKKGSLLILSFCCRSVAWSRHFEFVVGLEARRSHIVREYGRRKGLD